MLSIKLEYWLQCQDSILLVIKTLFMIKDHKIYVLFLSLRVKATLQEKLMNILRKRNSFSNHKYGRQWFK